MHKILKHFLILIIVLFFCVSLIITAIFCLFEMKKADSLGEFCANTVYSFYAEEKGSLDGIYLGSSAANRYWAPGEAFAKEGICIYNLGTTEQPFVATPYLIKDALKYQKNMDVILVEVRNLTRAAENQDHYFFEIISDTMPWSGNRTDMIDAYLAFSKEIGADIDYEKIDYYIPTLRDEGQWLDDFNIKALNNLYDDSKREVDKGYLITFLSKSVHKPSEYTERSPLEPAQEKVLRDTLEYCKGIEPEVIFVSAPFSSLKDKEGQVRTALDICEEEGFETLDFNCKPLQGQIHLDWSQDLYNYKHLNWYGAKKYTDFLASYLVENYNLKDHRQDAGYKSWHKAVDSLKNQVDAYENSDL